ncbi:HNH endonuclease signature motif containing protein [Mycobacterium sp. 1274761.0]|uniref:HNH endonuclease signature motif containing protein n=1 Tax=Mycobacterium sp. 1274761.0 TaxID=1834077 RepID=UPI0007FFFB3E|nr:HNH endonuclease signature motif containing protein [Mycobacterium sp. 1274761.0]OBK72011.1 HNH endonuclease [Mycobacterium sp. 1274761.0]
MFAVLVATASTAVGGAAVGGWARVENAACARRLSAMADMLEARWAEDGSTDREQWCFDNWNAVAAEVAASYEVSLGVASHQLLVALALRERLPRLAEAFATGRVTFRMVSTIVNRTALVTDPQIQAKIDVDVAAAVAGWGALPQAKVETAIDDWVERYDPLAVRRMESHARGRHVDKHSDGGGTSTIEAVLLAHDAEAVDARLDAMARKVCEADPRTLDQLRADALGALGHGFDHLACLCGSDDCSAAGVQPNAVVIHVIAEQKSLTDDTPVVLDGENPDKHSQPVPPPTGPARTPAAVMIAGAVLPAPLLAARIAAGATIRALVHPGSAPPEPRYRPSATLSRFIRCRDMTCRFPGCTKPAHLCDLDHTIAYPVGPTCASNVKCLCREHHLLKTFWSGPQGWRDEQLPDGTVIWTDPHRQTHLTRPGSYGLFPQLCEPTAPAHAAKLDQAPPGRGLAMPRRRRTRAQHRAARIDAERRRNEPYATERLAQRNKPPPF